MTIAAILRSKGDDVVSIAGNATVADGVALLAGRRIGAMPVLADGRVIGIFSERDVVHCLATLGAAALSQPIAAAMTADAVVVTPDVGVLTALSLMTRRRIRHLPVLDDGAITGFVSIGDLVKHRIDAIESEANAMRDYIQQA